MMMDRLIYGTSPPRVTGLLRTDQNESPDVGDLVTGEDGRSYVVTGRHEFGGTGRYLYDLERAP